MNNICLRHSCALTRSSRLFVLWTGFGITTATQSRILSRFWQPRQTSNRGRSGWCADRT